MRPLGVLSRAEQSRQRTAVPLTADPSLRHYVLRVNARRIQFHAGVCGLPARSTTSFIPARVQSGQQDRPEGQGAGGHPRGYRPRPARGGRVSPRPRGSTRAHVPRVKRQARTTAPLTPHRSSSTTPECRPRPWARSFAAQGSSLAVGTRQADRHQCGRCLNETLRPCDGPCAGTRSGFRASCRGTNAIDHHPLLVRPGGWTSTSRRRPTRHPGVHSRRRRSGQSKTAMGRVSRRHSCRLLWPSCSDSAAGSKPITKRFLSCDLKAPGGGLRSSRNTP